ncbi:unnamed protein product (macronuclear) [Paramecium tetraurelia]|uniref:LITAF domain-containing protein n=1 Tax=Paramecium tetraurelia TaxID=5888 RepID=A0E4Q3_PARTE|nr:uncharacterized protein GSPATT00023445001 [Paramecium tetraurelia]CAK90270.1 unnamed protein product [Paramecium tetraurelia]|eukprot:XP_001457667.1 hypothetical protein (macronuclear) [Paramecium tetraurelia strain d4-2]
MQDSQHQHFQSEMIPTPNDDLFSYIVNPPTRDQSMQEESPNSKVSPPQQTVHHVPFQRQPKLEKPVHNAQQNQIISQIDSKHPSIITCGYCQHQVQTVINYEPGAGTYLIGSLLAIVGLWFGCCLIPCFIDDCKDVVHLCPSCQHKIGKKRFIFD